MISSLKESHLITSYGIVADGKVDSVVLVSNTPLSQIKKIVLDQESRTSVLLAKFWLRNYGASILNGSTKIRKVQFFKKKNLQQLL
ncbi:MAG: hypothetical protein IPO63_14515 [Bacteroidetes bacterium]|nr:hypothetical protein [Bacteroidota bacterium]